MLTCEVHGKMKKLRHEEKKNSIDIRKYNQRSHNMKILIMMKGTNNWT